MTAPSYTEDLTDIDLAQATTNWDESSDANWDDGGAATADGDYPYLQGSMAITQQCTKASIASLLVNAGSGLTLPTDGAFFVWQFFASSGAVDTYANGGFRVMVGSSLGDFYSWDVGGGDVGRYPYGGWQNHAVNTTVSSDDTVGTPSGTQQFIGAAVKSLAAIGKGNPHAVDAVRYGRGSSIFEYGDLTNGYCTFAGFAAQNDDDTYMWGLIQATDYGFLWKGKMTLGTVSNAVDFRDSNVVILIDWCPKVTANFNTIEVNNTGSRVDWTNVQISALGTVSPGRLLMNDDADLNWDSCQFADMGDFTFGGTSSTVVDSQWRNCGQITANGATITGCSISSFNGATDESALVWNVAIDPDGYLEALTFVKGTASTHAIEFGTSSPTDMTIRDMAFSGYNGSHSEVDSTFYFARTSGTVTLHLVGCSGNMTYKSAGATIVLDVNPVTLSIKVVDRDNDPIQDAQCAIYKSSDNTQLMNEDSLSTGYATEPYTYTADTDVYWRVRKSSVGSTRYRSQGGTGTITSSGFSATVTLTEEPLS